MRQAGSQNNPIDFNWNPERLNSYLIQYYGYDLFDFAYSLAIVLRKSIPIDPLNIWLIKHQQIPYVRTCRGEIRRLRGIKDRIMRIISDLDDHLDQMKYWDVLRGRIDGTFIPLYFPVERSRERINRNNYIKRVYRLEDILQILTEEIGHYNEFLRLFRETSGRPIAPKTIITSFWSLIIRNRRGIELDRIHELLGWFYVRLEGTDYKEELRDLPGPEEISRFMRRFRNILNKDKSKIFVHNYHQSQHVDKLKVIQIRFERDEPKFFSVGTTQRNEIQHLIIFPENLNQ
jgi:hypothetical protein